MALSLSRRLFLGLSAGVGATSLLPGLFASTFAGDRSTPVDVTDWKAIRGLFELDPRLQHFASFFLVSHPRPVRDAIAEWRARLDKNPFETVEHHMFTEGADNAVLQVAERVSKHIEARPEDIALTGSTTQSLALVYHGLPLRPGDEVLATTHDHYSHHESIRLACERAGATSRQVQLYAPAEPLDVDRLVDRIVVAVGPKTRVVGLTWVHSSSGVRLPIRQMALALKARHPGLLIVVDGVHGLGSVPDAAATLGADYFCAGCHKWMFAPRGTGIIWSHADAWARLRPVVPSFSDFEAYQAWLEKRPIATPMSAMRMEPGGFHAYEHQWAMGAAFDLHLAIGRKRVGDRIAALNTRLKDVLAEDRRITLHTPRDPALSAGLVAFEVAGLAPDAVVARLMRQGIVASTSPYAPTYARLAPSLVNDEAETDGAAKAVLAMAA